MESTEKFEMVAKTLGGLEEVLSEELRNLGAEAVEPGRRMVSFRGDKEMLYKANFCCRTALRILKPIFSFRASTPDELYENVRRYDWEQILDPSKTFAIDTVAFGEEFTHSRYATYRVKDAIVDFFKDKYGADKRPGVRLENADVFINVHISGEDITISLDSSGESLHKRGYRTGVQTEAPLSEVLAAGIILMTGYRGDVPFVDPMCGSGTFLIEAALIAANIWPGVFRKHFAFENWPDFDRELFENIYNDDSAERIPSHPIVGGDISAKAIAVATENLKNAGVAKYVTLEQKPFAKWEKSPDGAGVLVTNPPYGKRISVPDMEALYRGIGDKLKRVFTGYHAWILGYTDEYFRQIGLAASQKIAINNGGLECELREYIMFEGFKRDFRASGGRLKVVKEEKPKKKDFKRSTRRTDSKPFGKARKEGDRKGSSKFGQKKNEERGERKVWRMARKGEDAGNFGASRRRPRDFSNFGRGPQLSPDKEVPLE